jgi:hypothetical protein
LVFLEAFFDNFLKVFPPDWVLLGINKGIIIIVNKLIILMYENKIF